jgi:hypothetical protein
MSAGTFICPSMSQPHGRWGSICLAVRQSVHLVAASERTEAAAPSPAYVSVSPSVCPSFGRLLNARMRASQAAARPGCPSVGRSVRHFASSACTSPAWLFVSLSVILPPPERTHARASAGTSVRNVVHWAQGVRASGARRFQRYDHGIACSTLWGLPRQCNQRKYGRLDPPEYDLGSIRVPVALFSGAWLAGE